MPEGAKFHFFTLPLGRGFSEGLLKYPISRELLRYSLHLRPGNCRQYFFENLERCISLSTIDNQRGHQAQGILAAAENEQPFFEAPPDCQVAPGSGLLLGRPVFHEFDPNHQAKPAHVADHGTTSH